MEKRFGIIGNPVKGSLSPLLFGAAYGGRFAYDLIEEPGFDKAWERFLEGYHGINVTAPFKEDAFRKAGVITPSAKAVGAANLIVKTPLGTEAHNTDFLGIKMIIAETVSNSYTDTPRALIVGCGGAGRAAAAAAAQSGFKTTVMNRSAGRARALAEALPEYGLEVAPVQDLGGRLRDSDLVIYTVPSAMDGLRELREDVFAPTGRGPKVLLEANYKTPSFSWELLETLHKGGCRYISGLRWLLLQAVAGYGIFTGLDPDAEAMRKVIGNIAENH